MCKKNKKTRTILYHSRFFVTSCYMKPCHSNNVSSNRKYVPNNEEVNIESHKQCQQKRERQRKKALTCEEESSGKELTIADAVITHLGLDMLGNVSIDSHLMMDCVLK